MSQRRAKNRVTMLYKIIINQVTIDPNTYLNKSDTRTRGEHKYKQIATSKNKYVSPPRTIRSWNYRFGGYTISSSLHVIPLVKL